MTSKLSIKAPFGWAAGAVSVTEKKNGKMKVVIYIYPCCRLRKALYITSIRHWHSDEGIKKIQEKTVSHGENWVTTPKFHDCFIVPVWRRGLVV